MVATAVCEKYGKQSASRQKYQQCTVFYIVFFFLYTDAWGRIQELGRTRLTRREFQDVFTDYSVIVDGKFLSLSQEVFDIFADADNDTSSSLALTGRSARRSMAADSPTTAGTPPVPQFRDGAASPPPVPLPAQPSDPLQQPPNGSQPPSPPPASPPQPVPRRSVRIVDERDGITSPPPLQTVGELDGDDPFGSVLDDVHSVEETPSSPLATSTARSTHSRGNVGHSRSSPALLSPKSSASGASERRSRSDRRRSTRTKGTTTPKSNKQKKKKKLSTSASYKLLPFAVSIPLDAFLGRLPMDQFLQEQEKKRRKYRYPRRNTGDAQAGSPKAASSSSSSSPKATANKPEPKPASIVDAGPGMFDDLDAAFDAQCRYVVATAKQPIVQPAGVVQAVESAPRVNALEVRTHGGRLITHHRLTQHGMLLWGVRGTPTHRS